MLKYMRLGDGMLARFNGMGVASPAGLATVLVYDDNSGTIPAAAPVSKYMRLDRGPSVLIMDVGRRRRSKRPPTPTPAACRSSSAPGTD